MHEKEKATHLECVAEYRKVLTSQDIDQEQNEHKPDTAKIAKKIADYVRVLRPRVLVSAETEVFEHPIFADLQGRFSQTEADAALDTLCLDVKRSSARTLILVDPVALDLGEVGRRTGCYVIPVRGAA
jgi:hypothetical protein